MADKTIDLTNVFLEQLLSGKNVEDLAQELSEKLNSAMNQYDEEKAKREEAERIAATSKEQAVQNVIDDIAILLSLYGFDIEEIFLALEQIDAKTIAKELEELISLYKDISKILNHN